MGRGVCLDFVLREMGTRGNLQGLRQENGRIRFSFFFFFNLFFKNFWLCWVFVAAHRLSLVAESGGYSSLGCAGFSLLWSTGSRRMGFTSCGMWLE